MSKRRFTDSDDDVWKDAFNPKSKRIRIQDGSSSAVNPHRYDPDFEEDNNAKSLMSDDEDDDVFPSQGGMETDNGQMNMKQLADASSFDNLLYQLASMDVGGGSGGGGGRNESGPNEMESEQIETCPICVARMPLAQFANHVYRCLDGMDVNERMDLRTQLERDEEMAISMVQRDPYRYSQDMSFECPICQQTLSVGMEMNVHMNECLDAQEADEASTAMGKFSIESAGGPSAAADDDDGDNAMDGASGNNRAKAMTREQMSACANALLSNPKGSAEYDSMLSMFETLGFNEKNIRRVVEEGKKENMMRNDENDDKKGREEEEGSMMMTDGIMGESNSMSSSFSFPSAPPPTPMVGFSGSRFGQQEGEGKVGGNNNSNIASGFGPGMFSNPSTVSSFGGLNDENDGFGGGMDDISDSEL